MRIHPAIAVILAAILVTALAPHVADAVAFTITPLNYLGLL